MLLLRQDSYARRCCSLSVWLAQWATRLRRTSDVQERAAKTAKPAEAVKKTKAVSHFVMPKNFDNPAGKWSRLQLLK